jgi:L-threonylcarbamoyladenylate synthase
MPDHEVALALLERTGPLAVSSANLTGQPAATDAKAAATMLGDHVEVVLDGGTSPQGEASTILDVRSATPRLLRLGALSVEALNAVLEPLGAAIPSSPETPAEAE